MAINISGLTYYKLEKNTYDGDITKYCSLNGTEIDGNFNFLRGSDIKNGYYDDSDGTLYLIRQNGDEIILSGIGDDIRSIVDSGITGLSLDGSYFDSENGIFHIMFNGEETIIDNFKIETPFYTDSTINGNGTQSKPLAVSKALLTGYHTPAKNIIDITNGETLPNIAEVCDCYVTKEELNKYGFLYNKDGIKEIEAYLKENYLEWHIPSDTEWGNMLNCIEECNTEDEPLKRNHNIFSKEYEMRGERAGLYLKSKDGSWNITNDDIYDTISSYYFTAYPTNNEDNLLSTSFWSSDNNVRMITDNADGVFYIDNVNSGFYPVRLVKNIDKTCSNGAKIDEKSYETVIMPFVTDENVYGNQLWTRENISLKVSDGNYTEISFTEDTKEIVYYICVWDVDHWDKQRIDENDLVPFNIGPDNSEDEVWVLKDGKFQKCIDIINNIISTPIYEKITEVETTLTDNINSVETNLTKNINEVKTTLTKSINVVSNDVKTLSSSTISSFNKLTEKVNALDEEEKKSFTEVKNSINSVNNVAKNNQKAIETLSASTVSLEKNVSTLSSSTVNRLTNINNNIEKYEKDTSKLYDSADKRITNLENQTDHIYDDIDSIKNDLSANITSVENKIDSLSANTTENFVDITNQVNSINKDINEIIDALEGKSDTIEVSEKVSDVTLDGESVVENKIATLKSKNIKFVNNDIPQTLVSTAISGLTVSDANTKTISELLTMILFPEIYPTGTTPPSIKLLSVTSSSNLVKVGNTVTINACYVDIKSGTFDAPENCPQETPVYTSSTELSAKITGLTNYDTDALKVTQNNIKVILGENKLNVTCVLTYSAPSNYPKTSYQKEIKTMNWESGSDTLSSQLNIYGVLPCFTNIGNDGILTNEINENKEYYPTSVNNLYITEEFSLPYGEDGIMLTFEVPYGKTPTLLVYDSVNYKDFVEDGRGIVKTGITTKRTFNGNEYIYERYTVPQNGVEDGENARHKIKVDSKLSEYNG